MVFEVVYLRCIKSHSMKHKNLLVGLRTLLFLLMLFALHPEAQALDSLTVEAEETWRDTLSSVGVEAAFRKERPIHPLVYGSGRSFSTEEAYRYAGSLGDVARMVRSYAGVACPDDSRNDISVRGGSPSHLLWRIDGYEMANPNHFASIGLTGSTVSLLNSNLIANSDFLTGAFPAEYGNVLSGVFDLHLRPAAEDWRFRVQSGWNGFELGAEGPFSKCRDAGSFQAAYRYSFLDLLAQLGMDTGIRPKYQDFTLKLERNLSAHWSLSALALWGISRLTLEETGAKLSTGSSSAFAGLCLGYDDEGHNKAAFRLYWNRSRCVSDIEQHAENVYGENQKESRYSLSAKWENRSVPRNYWVAGAGLDVYDMHFFSRSATMLMGNLYFQDEFRFSDAWKMTAGLRLQTKHLLNHKHAKPEARAALQYRINGKHRLALAYGRHHQAQVHTLYLSSNETLDFTRADHVCLSYDWFLAEKWRLKADAYYQFLSDVPVEREPSAYSALNVGADFYIPIKSGLVNAGKGRNEGVELTLEKFLDNRWYAMLNAHLFRSRYVGSDGVWRSSSYDLRHIVNAVAGYRFDVGKKYVLGTDAKFSTSGGKPATPLGGEFHAGRYPKYLRCDLKCFCRYETRRVAYEFAVDLQNLSNRKNILYEVYDAETQLFTYYYQTLFSPMYTFSVLF